MKRLAFVCLSLMIIQFFVGCATIYTAIGYPIKDQQAAIEEMDDDTEFKVNVHSLYVSGQQAYTYKDYEKIYSETTTSSNATADYSYRDNYGYHGSGSAYGHSHSTSNTVTMVPVTKVGYKNIYSDHNIPFVILRNGEVIGKCTTPCYANLPLKKGWYIVKWGDKVRNINIKFSSNRERHWYGFLDILYVAPWIVDVIYFKGLDWERYSLDKNVYINIQ
jgi:hypothetical protein